MPERLDHHLGGPQQRSRGQQPAAQPGVRVFRGVSAERKNRIRTGLRLQRCFSQILVCFTSSAVVTGPNSVSCTGVPGLLQQLSTYTNKSNFGYFDASWTPFRRLTARLGANLTGTRERS